MAKFPTCILPHSKLHVYTRNLQPFNNTVHVYRVVKSSRLLVKIAAYVHVLGYYWPATLLSISLRMAFFK